MHERAAERELLLHSTGQGGGSTPLERLELLVDRRDLIVFPLERRTEHGREEANVLLDAEIGIQREPARHVADPLAKIPDLPNDVAAEYGRSPGLGNEQRGKDTEERRLAGAVRADEPEQLTGSHANETVSSATVSPKRLVTRSTTTASSVPDACLRTRHRDAVTVAN